MDAPAINPVIHSRFAHETAIIAVGVAADGRTLLTTAEDRTVKVWTLPDLGLVAELVRQPDLVSAVVPVMDGFLLGRMDGGLERLVVPAAGARTPVAAAAQLFPSSDSSAATDDGAEAKPTELAEIEPNDDPAAAPTLPLPSMVRGAINAPGDADCIRFAARAGVPLAVEVIAARAKPASRVDSRVEVLHADGRPVEQVVLQAVRDSWFTFRGKNSSQASDFRLHNWEEMELDEYLYASGEVVKLWLYPRGPDSGFDVYPGAGNRHTFFHTSAVTHALGEPAWIVEPLPPGASPLPNGLPVFRLFYDNDDEPTRRLGTDSQLIFVPPVDGDYVARVTDVRGFGGSRDHHYTLVVRPPAPGFSVQIGGQGPKVSPGSGREVVFTVNRTDGFDGPVRIEVDGLPDGFTFHGPIEIEAGQREARGVLSATADAGAPDGAADAAVRVRAVARVAGRERIQELGTLGDIQLADKPKVAIEIAPGTDRAVVRQTPGEPLEFTIRPGQTITAKVRAVRHGFKDRIGMGREGVGRNLPHGVFVDNLGLNGLLIVEGQDEREFSITAAPKAPVGRRLFHLRTEADGGQASAPAVLNVLPAE